MKRIVSVLPGLWLNNGVWVMGNLKWKRWTADAIEQAVAMARSGCTADEIAETLGCDRKRVARKLQSLYVPTRNPIGDRWTDADIREAIRLCHTGLTQAAIGQAIGRTKEAVSRILSRVRCVRQPRKCSVVKSVGPVCRHCGDPSRPVNRPRGLCWRCFNVPGVRDRYPSTSKYAPHEPAHGNTQTEEELDRIIAEQMRPENLPSWWNSERS